MSEPGVKLRRRSGRQAPTSNYAEYIVEKSDEEDEEDEDLDKGEKLTRWQKRERERQKQLKEHKEDRSYTGGSGLATSKRPKKNKSKKTKKAEEAEKKPGLLLTLPMDILVCITTYLRPQDLLSMARVNRSLSTWLRSKDSQATWIQARKNLTFKPRYSYDEASRAAVTMPGPPAGMSEIAYAHMLFATVCQDCERYQAPKPEIHGTQRRLCNSCTANNVQDEFTVKAHINGSGGRVDPRLLSLVPCHAQAYHVPTIPKVHEIMKTKRAVLSKTAFKEWLSDRAQIVKQAQAHLPAIKEWERRFQRDYRTDEALEVERLSALYRTRILKLEEKVMSEAWYSYRHWEDFLDTRQHEDLVMKTYPFTDEELDEVVSAVKTYTEGAIAFKLERTEHVKNKRARRWTREKFALATQNLSTLAGFALGKGDVHALPSLHGFLKKRPVQAPEAGGGAFPDSSDEETANSVEDREADWCLAIPGIRKEARKSYIAILTSFALSLAKVATDPVLAGKLETALVKPSDADVGDDSLDQHLSSLSHCLNSVYAVFSCSKCHGSYHASLMRLKDALQHSCFTTTRVHHTYNDRLAGGYAQQVIAAPFNKQTLLVCSETIYITDVLLRLCAREAGALPVEAPETSDDVQESFDKHWRFICENEYSCNVQNKNMFTGHVQRTWDQMLSHVRQHAFYSRRYFDDPLRASQITIVPYKNYFPEKKKLTIEESDSEEEEDGGLAPVASTASADLEQASSPLSDVDMAPLDPVSDAESPPLSPLSDLSDVMSP